MTLEQIKANFRSAHAKQLSVVADAQFNQLDAAASLAAARATLRDLERQFKEDMAAPQSDGQTSIPFVDVKKK